MANDQETLRDVLTAQARRYDKQVFLECGDQAFSYAVVDDRTDRAATALRRLGLRIGERVALLMSNRPEYVFFLLGIPKIGMVPSPVNTDASRESIIEAIQSSGAAALVTESRFAGLRGSLPSVQHWIVVDDDSFADPPFESLTGSGVLGFWPDLDPDDPALISRTRGSKGKPKAAILTHRNLISSALQLMQPFRVDGTDRFFCAMPLDNSMAEVLLLVPLLAGATCILGEPFSARTPKELEGTGATVLAGTAQLIRQMAGSPEFAGRDLSSLRLVICTGGPAGEELFDAFERRHDALIVEGYGLVEATGLICANPYTGVRKPGSLGLPLPGQECRVVDERGHDLPACETGEIVVRGSNVMKGYAAGAEATARTVRDGWLHTGDRGYVDSDGYYFLENSETGYASPNS